MEIIHLVLGKANPDRMNGVNRVVHQLATQQVHQGRNVSVWGITKDTTRNFEERTFKTELFPAMRNPFGISPALRKAIGSKKGTDVVFHLHGAWVPVYASLARLFKREGIRFVLTGHGGYNSIAMMRSRWMKHIYFHLFESTVLTHAHKIHSIGESEVDGLSRIYPNTKSLLLPYGFTPNESEQTRTPNPEGFTIGFVGRLDTYTKGLDLLIRAFEEFQKTENNSKLWIVGDGPGRADLDRYIAQHGVRNVVLWGSKFGKDKDQLMSQMHVFTHPSRNEGLPASVLEAAAMGIPVVVSRATNVAADVEAYGAGMALAENTAEGLTKAFIHLNHLDPNSMNTMSEQAKTMVADAFSWNRIVPNFDQLYR